MESDPIRQKHPDKIPVICFYNSETKKFLVPGELTLSQFIYFYRKNLKLKPDTVFYIQIEGRNIINFNDILADLYDFYHSDDFCLYLHISNEAAMGTKH